MIDTIDEIRKLKEQYRDFYKVGKEEQATDNEFYQDTFTVPQIRNPIKLSRTGAGAQLIDTPVNQITSARLVASVKPVRETNSAKESALRISSMLNEVWLDKLMKQNPNPLHEFVKNLFLRGEAWLHPLHKEAWVTKPYNRMGLPIVLPVPDPLVIFASPNEDENGVPENAIVFYERLPWIVKAKYPAWSNPKEGQKNTIEWFEFWSSKKRYFEADGEPVLQGGIQENIYGFVPFIHKLGGFGKSSPTGKPEDLIVGRLRQNRDLLRRDCAITSDIDNTFHMFANKNIDVQPIDGTHQVPLDFFEKYEMQPGIGHIIPYGIKATPAVAILPGPEALAYLYSIKGQLGLQTPLALTGVAVGESGRLQDIAYGTAMRTWGGIVQNTVSAFATAFEMHLRMLKKDSMLVPDGLKSGDISEAYAITMELKGDDPIANDRLATRGSRLFEMGQIDLRTNLIDFQGYTAERADDIIIDILVDKVSLFNPDWAAVLGMVSAGEAGMQQYLDILRQRTGQAEAQQRGLQEIPPETTKERRLGETKMPLGEKPMDVFMGGYGARRSPTPYTRGR